MEVIIKEAGNRLDKSLADLTELSRSQANEAIKAGTVLVNGKLAKAKYVVKEGDVITYVLPEEEVFVRTPNRSLNHTSIVRQIAMHDSHILAKRLLILKLSCQSIVGLIILSNHKETRRVLIDTVNNPRTNHAIDR